MPIPDFNEHGFLPEGVHTCTLAEVQRRLGRFHQSDRRPRLFARLQDFMAEVKSSGIVLSVVLDGSFVTAEAEPNDIDIILVLSADHDYEAELSASPYNVVDAQRVRRVHGLDIVVVNEGATDYDETMAFFSRVRAWPALRKGLLRVVL